MWSYGFILRRYVRHCCQKSISYRPLSSVKLGTLKICNSNKHFFHFSYLCYNGVFAMCFFANVWHRKISSCMYHSNTNYGFSVCCSLCAGRRWMLPSKNFEMFPLLIIIVRALLFYIYKFWSSYFQVTRSFWLFLSFSFWLFVPICP